MALFKSSIFLQKFSFVAIIILFFLLIKVKCNNNTNDYDYNKKIGEKCSSNLECDSACCSSDKCSETSKCKKLIRIVYIITASVCLLFIIVFTIYLIIKLKEIKKEFLSKTTVPEEVQKKQDWNFIKKINNILYLKTINIILIEIKYLIKILF